MAPEIIWIINPDSYDPALRQARKKIGEQRVQLLTSAGFRVRVMPVSDLVAAWSQRPRLWWNDEDLLAERRGFLMSAWPWDPGTAQHFRAVSRTIRASDSVVLNDGLRDPERFGLDKLAMYQQAGAVGVPVLPTVAVPFGRYTRRALAAVRQAMPDAAGYIVKPREMATGFGVVRADDTNQLAACLDLLTPSGLGCLIQPYLPNRGDLRVYVHKATALAGIVRRPDLGNYRANVSHGASIAVMDVPADVAKWSVQLAQSVDADYLCVDWLLSDSHGPVFNEWMTLAAGFEEAPEPERSRVATAFTTTIAELMGVDRSAQRC